MQSGKKIANQKLGSMYRIRDVRAIVSVVLKIVYLSLFALIGWIVVGPELLGNMLRSEESGPVFFVLLIIIIAFALLAFRLRAIWNGLVVDIDRGNISYPGSGVALNNFADIFKRKYVFQHFCRFQTQLDQIRMMGTRDFTYAGNFFLRLLANFGRSYDEPPADISRTIYYLDFNGSFGAVSLEWKLEAKRDEAYSYIRQYGEFGIPIVNA